MKMIKVALCGAALCTGCATHQAMVDTSINEAESIGTIAQVQGVAPEKMKAAQADLKNAKAFKEQKEYEKAWASADASNLESRLALANVTLDSVSREDSSLVKDLKEDTERLAAYQSILDQETNKGNKEDAQ